MPNWCANVVEITAPEEILHDLEVFLMENDGVLEYFSPLGDRKDRVLAWGTKWEVDAVAYERFEETIVLKFDTAWGAPIEAVRDFANRVGAKVKGYYMEPGLDFCGVYTATEGDEEEYSILEAPHEIQDEFPNIMMFIED